jgi:N-acetyl-anhydromuramyl-L-alanine amidase AmpD
MNNNPQYIVLHHTASPMTQTFETINAYHKKKYNYESSLGYYVGYHYVIDVKGHIYQARAHTDPGAHTKENKMNYRSLGVCLTGWFDDGHDSLPNEKQRFALKKLLTHLMEQENIPWGNIRFHRDYTPKSCPGNHITKSWIYQLLEVGPYENKDILKELNMNLDQLEVELKKRGFIKKRVQLNQDMEDGSVWWVDKGKRYKIGTNDDDIAVLAALLSAEQLSDVERAYPVTTNRKDVI